MAKEREKGRVAGKEPIDVDVKKGEIYVWCSCGRSKNQPFCDGSDEGFSFEPVAFTAKKTETVKLCTCKQTDTPPYCDCSHEQL